MVRGKSRRVIVLNSPDTDLFEQAIFIVRGDVAEKENVTAEALVDEACRVARSYSRTHTHRKSLWRRAGPFFLCAALSAALLLALSAAGIV